MEKLHPAQSRASSESFELQLEIQTRQLAILQIARPPTWSLEADRFRLQRAVAPHQLPAAGPHRGDLRDRDPNVSIKQCRCMPRRGCRWSQQLIAAAPRVRTGGRQFRRGVSGSQRAMPSGLGLTGTLSVDTAVEPLLV